VSIARREKLRETWRQAERPEHQVPGRWHAS
jgi:hypothetical protein